MKVFVVSKETFFPGEGNCINGMFNAGLNVFHLRKPYASLNEHRQLLMEIDKPFHSRIALHQFHEELAPEFCINRLHFKEQKRIVSNSFELDLLKEKGFSLSTSVHDPLDLDGLSSAFKYCFLGPMFDSLSKKNYPGRGFSLNNRYPFEVLAIGGITPYKIDTVIESGFDGIALSGYLWNEEAKAVEKFKEVMEKWVLNEQLS